MFDKEKEFIDNQIKNINFSLDNLNEYDTKEYIEILNHALKTFQNIKKIILDYEEEKEETKSFRTFSKGKCIGELPLINTTLQRNNKVLSSLVQLNDVLQKLDNNTIVTVYDISNKILYDGPKEDIYKSNLVIDNLYIDHIKIYADKIVDPFMLILVKELN